jgi:hypothetical protein
MIYQLRRLVRASQLALPFVPSQYVLVLLPVTVHESINCSKILQTILSLGTRKEVNEDLARSSNKRKERGEMKGGLGMLWGLR